MSADQALEWICLAAAVAALGVYLWIVAIRSKLIRLMTGLGFFLTGVALFQAPEILAATTSLNVRLALGCLVLAVVAQIAALLRTRPSWSGAERRAPLTP
jgi:uncharacterized protein involved in exopolysaccharide biosynthesis